MADEGKTGAGEESADADDAARAESGSSDATADDTAGGETSADGTSSEEVPAELQDEVSEPTDEEIAALEQQFDADGDRVPEPVGASAAGAQRAGRPVKKAAEVARKDRPTPKRDGDARKNQRTGPVTFVKESVAELRKVVYPTGQQLLNYFVVVLIFVLFIIAIVSVLDLAFGAAMFRIFA